MSLQQAADKIRVDFCKGGPMQDKRTGEFVRSEVGMKDPDSVRCCAYGALVLYDCWDLATPLSMFTRQKCSVGGLVTYNDLPETTGADVANLMEEFLSLLDVRIVDDEAQPPWVEVYVKGPEEGIPVIQDPTCNTFRARHWIDKQRSRR